MTDTKTAPTKEQFETRYRALVALVMQVGGDAQQRIAGHIRAISKGRLASLGIYHVAASIPLAEKYEQYALIASALGLVNENGKNKIAKPDWSRLQGSIGNGAKAAEVEEVAPKRADPLEVQPVEEAPAPARFEPEAGDDVPEPAAEPRIAKSRKTVALDDDDASALAALRKLLAVQQEAAPAAVDEGVIRLIAQEEIQNLNIGDMVKRANMNGAFPADRVTKLIEDAMANMVRRVELVMPNGETKPIAGLVHRQFDTILKMTRSRTGSGHPVPIWLDGPPGGGKSHLMEQIAEALELSAYILAIGPTDTKSAIVGSVATGEFRPGIAYLPYKDGGVLGIDEIAAGDPGVLVSTNALVANQSYRFPNGELVKKHKNFHVIVADNTRGHGNVKGMIRNRLDAATLDRFAFLKVDYDEQLESVLCGNAAWSSYVQKVRGYIASNSGESVYITPRASINGAALLAGGLEPALVADMTLFKFTSPDMKATIIGSVGGYEA